MKLALISHTAYPDFIGGREQHIDNLARAFGKTDDVWVIAGGCNKTIMIRNMNGYRLITLPMLSLKVSSNPLQIYRIIPSLFSKIKDLQPDVIHAFEYGSFSTGASCFYAKKYKTPFFLTSYGYQLGNALLRAGKIVYDRTVGKKILQTAKKIFCPSSVQSEEIEQILLPKSSKDKIVLQPNCIDVNEYKNVPYPNDLVKHYKLEGVLKLVCATRILPRKGLKYLILALDRLVNIEKKNKIKLLIIGPDCGQRKELESLIIEKMLGDHIAFTGNASHGQIKRYLALSDIFVLPSLYEGLPLSLLEAMASKKAVIFSRLECAQSLIKHLENGLLVEPGAVDDLADKISMIYHNKKLLYTLGANASETVKAYDVSAEAIRTRKIYASDK
jgi:glycosyltransferase involved in cell wall biosynthesis